MANFLSLIWWFARRIYSYFINPGYTNGGTLNITIPKLITNYPILFIFFAIPFIFMIIHLFNRLRRMFI